MAYQTNDTLLAFKAIALHPSLNGTDKQVGAFLIDSYNIVTQRCDPSEGTASVILGKSTRTIVRSVENLVKAKLFRKIRHGGQNYCNRYVPNWMQFRELESFYKLRREKHKARFDTPKVSPAECQHSHMPDDSVVTQTYPTKHIQLTYPDAPSETCRSVKVRKRLSDGEFYNAGHMSGLSQQVPHSRDVHLLTPDKVLTAPDGKRSHDIDRLTDFIKSRPDAAKLEYLFRQFSISLEDEDVLVFLLPNRFLCSQMERVVGAKLLDWCKVIYPEANHVRFTIAVAV